MIVATPVTEQGESSGSWGKAHWVAVGEVADGALLTWEVHEVAWDESHDVGAHGAHHARIVRFLRGQKVEAIVVDHVGPGMVRMLGTMGIPILPATPGDPKVSVLKATAAA